MAISFDSDYGNKHIKKHNNVPVKINIYTVITFSIIIVILISLFFNKNVFAKAEITEYETNYHTLDIQNIISQNADVTKFKSQVSGEFKVPFETIYYSNNNLPKDEQVVFQEGTYGKKKVSSIRTYENKELIDETILSEVIIQDSTPQLIYIGTSEFLSTYNIHLDDTIYLIESAKLKENPDETSKDLISIKQYMNVVLLELVDENWAKISFDGITGYIQTSKLTSEHITPDIVSKNKIQRLLSSTNINMKLNSSSDLSLDEFKKILTNLPSDKNKIFENNYEVFYNVDRKYNINGVFLAALAIHESGWGTSKIANDKKNLFGFGAYDSNPYEYAVSFDDYQLGIEAVAKHLVKQYLNEPGTKIYDDEIAQGLYYNEPTLQGVNTRYATDPEWYLKVFKHMEELYDRLSL